MTLMKQIELLQDRQISIDRYKDTWSSVASSKVFSLFSTLHCSRLNLVTTHSIKQK